MGKFFSKYSKLCISVFILSVALCAFSPVLKSDFVHFHGEDIVLEDLSRYMRMADYIKDAFGGQIQGKYAPLTFLSYAIEYHFFDDDPFYYHLDNILLHLLAVFLIYCLALRLNLSSFSAAVAALLFGVHPFHVEVVSSIVSREHILSFVFFLLSIIFYIRFLDFDKKISLSKQKKTKGANNQYRKNFFLLPVFIFAIFTMLSSPLGISVVFIPFLFDWFYERKFTSRLVLEKMPFFFVGIILVMHQTYLIGSHFANGNFAIGLLSWAWLLIFYCRQILYPILFIPFYRIPEPIIFLNSQYFFSCVFLIISVGIFYRFKRSRWLIFSFAFFGILASLLIFSYFLRNVPLDPGLWMYSPSVGFCLFFGFITEKILSYRLKKSSNKIINFFLKKYKILFILFIFIAFVPLIMMTYRQGVVWSNGINLWKHQLKSYPNDSSALNSFASALRIQKEYQKAEVAFKNDIRDKRRDGEKGFSTESFNGEEKISHLINLYKKSMAANPQNVDAYYNLADLYGDIGVKSKAIKLYEKIIKDQPEERDAYFYLGNLYAREGSTEKSIRAYKKFLSVRANDERSFVKVILAYNEALKNNSKNGLFIKARNEVFNKYVEQINKNTVTIKSLSNLGYLYHSIGDIERAISAYLRALDIDADYVEVIYRLGHAYKDRGYLDEALAMYREVLKLSPKEKDVNRYIGTIYGRQKKYEKAIEYCKLAGTANPEGGEAYFDLGYMYEAKGNLREAMNYYQKAIKYMPDNANIYYNLGNIYSTLRLQRKAAFYYKKSIELDPRNIDAHVNLSIAFFKQGQYEEAIRYCDIAIILGYDAPEFYLQALQPYKKNH